MGLVPGPVDPVSVSHPLPGCQRRRQALSHAPPNNHNAAQAQSKTKCKASKEDLQEIIASINRNHRLCPQTFPHMAIQAHPWKQKPPSQDCCVWYIKRYHKEKKTRRAAWVEGSWRQKEEKSQPSLSPFYVRRHNMTYHCIPVSKYCLQETTQGQD